MPVGRPGDMLVRSSIAEALLRHPGLFCSWALPVWDVIMTCGRSSLLHLGSLMGSCNCRQHTGHVGLAVCHVREPRDLDA